MTRSKKQSFQEVCRLAVAATRAGDSAALRAMLTTHGAPLAEAQLDEGYTLLHHAAQEGRLDCLRELLPYSDAQAETDEERTPLHFAAAQGHADCVASLLPLSDPGARVDSGETALMFAAEQRHVECVKLLLPVSDVAAQEAGGETALTLAAEGAGRPETDGHRAEVFAVLMTHASKIDRDDFACAVRSVIHDDDDLALGALLPHLRVNGRNEDGNTMLEEAASEGRVRCVSRLAAECSAATLAKGCAAAVEGGHAECASPLLPLMSAPSIARTTKKLIEIGAGNPASVQGLDDFLVLLSHTGVDRAEEWQSVAIATVGPKTLPRTLARVEERALREAVESATPQRRPSRALADAASGVRGDFPQTAALPQRALAAPSRRGARRM